jgi:DNA-binding response OmpR family regulator/DNA-binding CsgD family transcriptional regulator
MPEPASILVVDDVPANLGLLLDALGRSGYRVLVAESGESALDQLDHEVPGLILLDYLLPGLNGLEICRRIKTRPDCRDVPILFLTAVTDVGEKVRALEAGAVDYVTKPIQEAEVLARVRTHLRIASLQRELREEIELREEAENLLRDGLHRALIVVDANGIVQFATRLARTLLEHKFPGEDPNRLPRAILQRWNSPSTTAGAGNSIRGLHLRVFHPPDHREVSVLELESPAERRPSDLLALGLTPREAEVLFWICEGKSNPEIGIILGSAARTVEKHVENILRKLGVPTRAAAVSAALDALRR